MVECLLLSILGPQLGMHGTGRGGGDSCCSRLVHTSDPPPRYLGEPLRVPKSSENGELQGRGQRAPFSHRTVHLANSTQGEPLSPYQLPWRARHIPSLLLEWIPEFNSSAPAGVPLPGGELNPSSLSRPAFSELGLPGLLIFSSALHSAVLLIQPSS